MKNKRILIFGGSGSLGTTLINRWVTDNVVCIFSRDESKHWLLKHEIKNDNLNFIIGDVRDYHRVRQAILEFGPQIIIIASALKHVDVCEMAPKESVLTNVTGPINVAEAAGDVGENIETVLMVSTDKACAPINVYGMSKAIAERAVLDKGRIYKTIKFIGVRYGNVLMSRGSIVPLFLYQAKHQRDLTITSEHMTRFLMTLTESAELIENAVSNGKSGEIYIPKLISMKIYDLANIFAKKYNVVIKDIGIRTGEKIHESLINETESLRVIDNTDTYTLMPSYDPKIYNHQTFDYNSAEHILTETELKDYLERLGTFDDTPV